MAYGWKVKKSDGTFSESSDLFAATLFLGEARCDTLPASVYLSENEEAIVHEFESPVVNVDMVTMEQLVGAIPLVFSSMSSEVIGRIVSVRFTGFKIIFRVSIVKNPTLSLMKTIGFPRFFCFLALRSIEKSDQNVGSRVYDSSGNLIFDSGWGFHTVLIKEVGEIAFEPGGSFPIAAKITYYPDVGEPELVLDETLSDVKSYDLICFPSTAWHYVEVITDIYGSTSVEHSLYLHYDYTNEVINGANGYTVHERWDLKVFEHSISIDNRVSSDFENNSCPEAFPGNGGLAVNYEYTVPFVAIDREAFDNEIGVGDFENYDYSGNPEPALVFGSDVSLFSYLECDQYTPFVETIAFSLASNQAYRISANVDSMYTTGYIEVKSLPSGTIIGVLDTSLSSSLNCDQLFSQDMENLFLKADVVLPAGDSSIVLDSEFIKGSGTLSFSNISVRSVSL